MLVSALFSALLGSAAAQQCSGSFGLLTNAKPPAPFVVSNGNTAPATYSDNIFNFRLSAPPSGPVTVAVATSATNVALSPTSLSFTPDNWNIAQPVALKIAPNSLWVQNTTATVTFSAANSGGLVIPAINYPTQINLHSPSFGGCWFNPMGCFLW